MCEAGEMKLSRLLCVSLLLLVSFHAASAQQDRGYWRAASKTAASITGDLALSEYKVSLNFSSFTIAEIRDLSPAEVSAVFAESDASQAGKLYRVSIPGDKMFLHHNTLCGGDETQWMATSAAGKMLQVAFLSGGPMPTLTGEAMANATNLCGTYTYVK
jgi:hypothetical protein